MKERDRGNKATLEELFQEIFGTAELISSFKEEFFIMKKTLVSALTAALVVGAASTTFAAANPFSDVPSDSWAYDAVSQLAADGVIEGYGDGTFRGQQNITRYEMAQMVAKAMAKSNVSAADKALIDKLAAEFSDELNNLGVRVSNLERNADMVKWNGKMEYTYGNYRDKDYNNGRHAKSVKESNGGNNGRETEDQVLFRLEPSAEVNDHWHVNARLDAYTDMKNDNGDNTRDDRDNSDVKLQRIWAQGDYGKFQTKLGKFASVNDDSYADTQFSGAEVSYGSTEKGWRALAAAGRISSDDFADSDKIGYKGGDGFQGSDSAANYQYYGLQYALSKFNAGAYYHHLNANDWQYKDSKDNKTDEFNLWALKGAYQFNNDWGLNGFFAQNHDADKQDNAWSAEVTYKAAQPENANTWGAWAAYRYLGENGVISSTYDAVLAGQKAWEVGAAYVPFKNVQATVRYANGKDLWTDNKVENLWGRVEFFF